jgi:hypothetical protein
VFIRRVFSSRPSNVDLAPAPLAGVFFCAQFSPPTAMTFDLPQLASLDRRAGASRASSL